MPNFLEALAAAARDDDSDHERRPKLAPDIEALRLRDSFAALNQTHEFRPGMIVRQKPGARLYRDYGENDLAIVVELLAEPIIDPASAGNTDDIGSSYYRHRADMVIGSLEGRGSFACFHVDSRRFEPAPDEVLCLIRETH